MRVLLDTNIIIHREASRVVNQDIGVLFKWLDRLHHKKCVHPMTADELKTHKDPDTVSTMQIKLTNYDVLSTVAPLDDTVRKTSEAVDTDSNDHNDSLLLNEVYSNRVDILITEDKKIHAKAALLGISDRVFRIETYLEKVIAENPDFVDYKILSAKRDYFGNINLKDSFFDSFRSDYLGFDKWYNGKAGDNEMAYVCYNGTSLAAFLYLKIEDEKELYPEITPTFGRKRRLKIGTFKVVSNGLRIGERFLKIVFDNARRYKVDEIYVTIFDKRPELLSLIALLERFGFKYFGEKTTSSGVERVLVREFSKLSNDENPRLTFPWLSRKSNVFVVPIRPEYHTELFPDSILRTESPTDFIENQPHRNAISKSYISHSLNRDLKSGDILVFYRSGGIYKGVATTVGIVENIADNLANFDELIRICRKRTVLSEKELREYWDRRPKNRPFVVNFLYAFSFIKRMTLKEMLDQEILPSMEAVKTITKMERTAFAKLITLSGI